MEGRSGRGCGGDCRAATPPPPNIERDRPGPDNDHLAACLAAAERDIPAAHFVLGEMHRAGGALGEALRCYRRAAGLGHAEASRALGELLAAGGSGQAAPHEARQWLEEAAKCGDAQAIAALADLLWRAGDATAEPWLRHLAEAGDVDAKARLGELLLQTPDPAHGKAAFRLLAEAARRNHPRALLLLGRLHVRQMRDPALGNVASHSPKKAVELLSRAAEQNVAEAHWDLSRLLEQSGLIGRDLRRARLHLETAARAGITAAQIALARRQAVYRSNMEAQLEAGHWLQMVLTRGPCTEAEALLATIADQAEEWPAAIRDTQEKLLPRIAESHPCLTARLRLAAEFRLTTREALFIDLLTADRSWCLAVDLRQHFRYKPWRLVLITTTAQRTALNKAMESALPSFRGEADTLSGDTRARARRLASILGALQIDPVLFIHDWQPPS